MGARGANGNNDGYWAAIINAWLAFLDGAEPRTGIVVVAATNFPDRVDAALRRPGRLDRHVEIPRPSVEDLPGIVRHHLGIASAKAAKAVRGLTPADIEQACRDAKRIARKAGRKVRADDVVAVMASRPKRTDPMDAWRCAVHEAGHALAAYLRGVKIHHLDLDFGCVKTDEMVLATARDFETALFVRLAARAAEQVVCGEVSAHCRNDIEQATSDALILHAQSSLGSSGLVHLSDSPTR